MTKSRDIADSTNRIDSSAADATAMTIDADENVLVGKTSVGTGTAGVQMKSDGETAVTRSGTPFIVNRLSSDGTITQFRKDGTTVGSIKSYNGSFLQIESADNQSGLLFGTTAYYPVKNGSLDNGNIDIGNGSNRFKDLYLSGSVYLGGTASANALDDYEEGTWTPTYAGTTTNPTITYHPQTRGNYTKIGNLVIANVEVITNSVSGGSGTLAISGLPFTASSLNRPGTGIISYVNNFATSNHPAGLLVIANSTDAYLYKRSSTDAQAPLNTALTTASLSSGSNSAHNQIIVTIVYRT